MTAPEDKELLERQMLGWYRAACAYRAKDAKGVADALIDRAKPDAEVYADSVSMLIVGATLTANEAAKALGFTGLGGIPAGDGLVLDGLRPGIEPTANERLAWILVLDAANNRFDDLSNRVQAYSTPDEAGCGRNVELTFHLLKLYSGIAEANLAGAS